MNELSLIFTQWNQRKSKIHFCLDWLQSYQSNKDWENLRVEKLVMIFRISTLYILQMKDIVRTFCLCGGLLLHIWDQQGLNSINTQSLSHNRYLNSSRRNSADRFLRYKTTCNHAKCKMNRFHLFLGEPPADRQEIHNMSIQKAFQKLQFS